MFDVQRLAYAAADFQKAHARWPDHAELLVADPSLPLRDSWQQAFRFEATGDQFLAMSAGVDGEWDTCDDVTSDPMRMATSARHRAQ